jgi:hypothetical protein
LRENLTLQPGVRYTVLAVNNLASIEPLVATDDPRRLATASRPTPGFWRSLLEATT